MRWNNVYNSTYEDYNPSYLFIMSFLHGVITKLHLWQNRLLRAHLEKGLPNLSSCPRSRINPSHDPGRAPKHSPVLCVFHSRSLGVFWSRLKHPFRWGTGCYGGWLGYLKKNVVLLCIETMSKPTRWAPTSDKWSYNPYTVIIIYISSKGYNL